MYESFRIPKDRHQTGVLKIFMKKESNFIKSKLYIILIYFQASLGEFSLSLWIWKEKTDLLKELLMMRRSAID